MGGWPRRDSGARSEGLRVRERRDGNRDLESILDVATSSSVSTRRSSSRGTSLSARPMSETQACITTSPSESTQKTSRGTRLLRPFRVLGLGQRTMIAAGTFFTCGSCSRDGLARGEAQDPRQG
jgi:hypothetical protein